MRQPFVKVSNEKQFKRESVPTTVTLKKESQKEEHPKREKAQQQIEEIQSQCEV
jgi:hypothetical protein